MKIREVMAIRDAITEGGSVEEPVGMAFQHADGLDREGKAEVQAELGTLLRAFAPERCGQVALLAGALVEIGGAPEDFPGVVFDRLAEMLEGLDVDDEEDGLPECFYAFEQAAMAALSRSPALRRSLPQRARLRANIRRYSERYGFLGKMLAVLDDEALLVVHAPTGRAWRMRIGGIADNFQLHTLLLGALAGEGPDRIAGRAPDAQALAEAGGGPTTGSGSMTSDWQLANGFALRADGTIDSEDRDRNWIWNEGVPEDIEPVGGVRVVLIGPSTYQRGWKPVRVFDGMVGRLEVEGRLPDAEAAALVRSLVAAQPA